MVSLVELLRNILKNMSTPNTIFPVGTVLAFTNNTDPNKVYTSQTWVRFAQGRTLVGVNESDSQFSSAGKTGGESTHKLTIAEMPSHSHSASNVDSHFEKIFAKGSAYYGLAFRSGHSDPNISVSSMGGDGAHNNLQPFETVFYWKRTA